MAETLSAFDQVEECNVYGVTVPHSDGRAGMAAVRMRGSLQPADFDGRRFFMHVQSLPAYAQPMFLRFLVSGPQHACLSCFSGVVVLGVIETYTLPGSLPC